MGGERDYDRRVGRNPFGDGRERTVALGVFRFEEMMNAMRRRSDGEYRQAYREEQPRAAPHGREDNSS